MKTFFERFMSGSAFFRSPDEGGAPAPSSPVETPPGGAAPAEGAGATTSDDFSGFSADDLDSVEISEPASEPGSTTEVPPVAAPVTPPAAAPAAPEAKPVPAPVAEPPAPKEASAPPPSEIVSAIEGMTQNAEAILSHLSTTTFALSKEEAEALELNAVEVIPKLMARVHLEAAKNTLNLINRMVPGLINQTVEKTTSATERAKEAVNEFYATNSDLNAKDHGALVTKWANVFRAQNPAASRQDAIKFVGTAIRTELGLAAPIPGAAPAARPQAFAPARPGAKAPIAQHVEASPFEMLGNPTLDDD